jgi:serine/threonine protein kinase
MSTPTPIDPEERTVIPGPLVEGNALPAGTRLGEFEVVGLIGEGGFGIVYLAYDHSLDRKVALKEYMPSALAERQGSTSVKVKSQRNAETFSAGLRSFINEARLLAQFDHPSLVKVYRFWVANGTAYMVMPFYEGITLKEALRRRGSAPDEAWLKSLLSQLLDALDTLHARQCYHRDIAPDNILMLSDNMPVLLDFGAARRVIGNSAQTLTVILKPGYAPIEQYAEAPNLKQGPWTDIYALGSVVYFAIAGHAPAPAVARVISDPLVPLSQVADGRYSDAFVEGIQAALAVRPDERPQDIESFRALLGFPKPQTKAQAREPESYAAATPVGKPVVTSPTSNPTPRVTQPSQPPVATSRPTLSASPPPNIAPSADAQVERLLAQYIGPMARIFCARAHKTSRTPDEFTKCLAEAIDDDSDRAAFIAAAAKLLRLKRH